jgi:hypothetical protein
MSWAEVAMSLGADRLAAAVTRIDQLLIAPIGAR